MSSFSGNVWLSGFSTWKARLNIFTKINWGRFGVISVPYLWLAIFFFVPFLVVFKISLAESAIAIPPYSDLLDFNVEEAYLNIKLNLGNYLLCWWVFRLLI